MATAEKFLPAYDGQTADELIALAAEYRIDSIVLAFEQALQARAGDGLRGLGEAEATILAVESLEREVNNGGYHQFFLNTPVYAPLIVGALTRIGCPRTAAITADALAMLGLRAGFTPDDVEAALMADAQGRLIETLCERCDARYDESGESIADRLFEYIRAQRAAIRLGKP